MDIGPLPELKVQVPVPTLLSHKTPGTKHKSQNKIINIFEIVTADIKLKSFLNVWPCETALFIIPRSQPSSRLEFWVQLTSGAR